jgi:hypothetical protein
VTGRATTPAPEEPPNAEIGSWDGLTRILRQTDFDDSNWMALASSAALLVHQLSLMRPPHPTADEALSRYVKDLERTLASASRSSAEPVQIRSERAYAAKVQGWMLQILSTSTQF